MKVFVNIPSKKNVLVLSHVAASKSDALKKHLGGSSVKLISEDYREKDQTMTIRTAEESDATTLQNWLKANPVEVHYAGNHRVLTSRLRCSPRLSLLTSRTNTGQRLSSSKRLTEMLTAIILTPCRLNTRP